METAISFRIGALLVMVAALAAACAPVAGTAPLGSGGVVERRIVSAPLAAEGRGPTCGDHTAETGSFASVGPVPGYRVGPGDKLRLNVFGEEGMTDILAGVDADGYVQLPMVEAVRVTGMTTREIMERLKDAYGAFFIDPWVTVELETAESAELYFLGEFRDPGVRYMNGATNLIEALALGGGLEEDAFLPGARLLRDDRICTVDLDALLRQGDFTQNVWMRAGDVIYAPRREDMSVYVIGAVAAPQAVPFGATGRTLLEAISIAGGQIPGGSLMSEVRIIRNTTPTRGELIVFDARRVLNGLAPDFRLEPGDVVWVPQNAVSDWNMAIAAILPTLELIGGVITPIALIQSLQE
jgi:polysaccharide export outer membrane protein